MSDKLKNLSFLIILTTILFSVERLRGQNMLIANPAELSDFRSAFVNPAIISFQDPHAALGGKLYHVGFVESQSSPFRQGFASLALPFAISSAMGFGIQMQYFDSPLYTQSNISFGITRRFRHVFAFGVKMNIFNHGFNRENFDLVDENDPVFANGTSKWSTSFGLGAVMMPASFVSFGVGLDHINRANVSLTNDDVYQPLQTYLGAVFNFGLLQASVSALYEEGKFRPKTSIGSFASEMGFFRLGYTDKAVQAEGQLRITGPFSLNYSYDYTLFDNRGVGGGSHQFAVIYDFGRQRDLPKIEIPNDFKVEFQSPDRSFLEESRFYVYPTTAKLEIIEKRITRHIDPTVKPEALAQLSLYELGVLDSSRTEEYLPFVKDTVDMDAVPAALDASLSSSYEDFIQNASQKGVKTEVVTSKETVMRAAALKKQFTDDATVQFVEPVYASSADSARLNERVGKQPIKAQETLTVLSQRATRFSVMPVALNAQVHSWRLVLTNANGQEIRSFTGRGMPPEEVEWDWRDQAGNLVAPGNYYFHLEWQDSRSKSHQSDKNVIAVQKLIRNITIEITHKPKPIGADVDEIDLILKK